MRAKVLSGATVGLRRGGWGGGGGREESIFSRSFGGGDAQSGTLASVVSDENEVP